MESIGASQKASLTGPANWYKWISIIKKFAISQDVWAFINLDIKHNNENNLIRPKEPTYKNINAIASHITNLLDK